MDAGVAWNVAGEAHPTRRYGVDQSTGTGTDWPEVYVANWDRLVRLAYLLTGSQAAAEDLVGDCFVRAMGHLDPDRAAEPYLRRSVVNACWSWHRRQKLARGLPAPEIYARSGPYDDLLDMWNAVGRLPARQRMVVVLRFYLDLTAAETASVLGWRVGTVKSASHRALAALRKEMGETR